MKRKNLIQVVLACLLAAVIIVAFGCSGGTSGETENQSESNEEVFRWTFQIWDSSLMEIGAESQVEMVERIRERSNGRLIIDLAVAGSLGYNGFDHHKVTSDGLVEMGEIMGAALIEVPEFGLFSHMMFFKSIQDVYKAADFVMPELEKALEEKWNVKLLGLSGRPPNLLHSTNKPFPTYESLRGATIRAWYPAMTEWVEEVGAIPVVTASSEIYTALSTGVIEANFSSPITQVDRKHYEVCEYTSTWPVTPVLHVVVVNRDAFNKLPNDLQKILVEEVHAERMRIRERTMDSETVYLKELSNLGVTIVEVPEEELAKGREAGKRVRERWLAEQPERIVNMHDEIIELLGY